MSENSSVAEPFPAVLSAPSKASPEQVALVVVDLTNFDAHPQYGLARIFAEENRDMSYYWERVERSVMPNALRLVDACRAADCRLMLTRVGAQFGDYGDSLPHLRQLHRRAGTIRGSAEFELREEFRPRRGEIVIDKSGASVFTTSNADTLLRNAAVKRVVFCGVITNVCVLTSALTAWDLGYDVTIVDDACAADAQETHEAALKIAGWVGCRIATTEDTLNELATLAQRTTDSVTK